MGETKICLWVCLHVKDLEVKIVYFLGITGNMNGPKTMEYGY